MIELNNLIKISKYAGERFDLVQSGGGNSSANILRTFSVLIIILSFSQTILLSQKFLVLEKK